jgi:hypothetical protein
MTLARAVAVRIYGWLFRLLIVFVPRAQELDGILDLLDGEADERVL